MPKEMMTAVIGCGHSLILAHTPLKLHPEDVGKKQTLEKKDTSSFGLFDTSTPNFNTYYPEVTAEDLKPKDDEFISPTFRLLSETIVHRRYNPIDFSMNGVLKSSMSKLLGQSVYTNHDAQIGNEVGSVAEVAWQDSYTTKGGLKVPAGIIGVLKIDGKSHPKIARAIMMSPPAIHSNSVTVSFAWEKSHPKMSDEEFMSKIGTFGEDKQLVRRIVTEIGAYHETSLVAHGADPWAQVTDGNGKIINPEYAVSQNSAKGGSQVYFYSYKTDLLSLSAEEDEIKNLETQSDTNMLKELQQFLGLDDATTFEQCMAKLQENKAAFADSQTAVTNLTAQVNTLNEELTTLKGQTPVETPEHKIGKAHLVALKAETVANHKKVYGDANAFMLDIINNATEPSVIEGFNKQFTDALEAKFPLTCKDCNGHNVSRASASEEGSGGSSEGQGNPVKKTRQQVEAEFSKANIDVTHLHGQK
jgi:hypothetical protein